MKNSKKKIDKIDQDTLEKFAKEKNIDKNKIEDIANSYQGKSEDELLDELISIGKNLKGKEEVVSKFKNFLNPEQQQKLDSIMNKISEAEIQDKINAKKSKAKKSSSHHSSSGKKKFEALDEKTKKEFKNKFDKLGEIRQELSALVDKDTESFNEFMKAVKMPKETEEEKALRTKAIEDATIFSIEVPYKTASLSLEALKLLDFLVQNGNQNAITDIGVGTLMLATGMEGAILNVKVNLGGIENKEIHDKYSNSCRELLSEGKKIKDSIISNIHRQLD